MFYLQKLFGHQMAEFRVTIENMWSNDGTFETVAARPEHITPTKVKGMIWLMLTLLVQSFR